MTTSKIIAENILEADHFLSATEQAGPYIGQPVPNAENAGAFTLLSTGDIEDFVYNGTTTAIGDTTTLTCEYLKAYGDDFFVGATVAITSGACDGESQTVSAFNTSVTNGLITVSSAFTDSILLGVTFTLTLAYSARDFRVELVAGGDAGAADYKWSHDGGVHYFGRSDPAQATWLSQLTVASDVYYNTTYEYGAGRCCLLPDGNIGVFYIDDDTPANLMFVKTNDGGMGMSWDSPVTITTIVDMLMAATVTSSGRVLVYFRSSVMATKYLGYSDDSGETWAYGSAGLPGIYLIYDVVELSNGNLMASLAGLTDVKITISSDTGVWSDPITINSDSNAVDTQPALTLLKNGYVFCSYTTDNESAGDTEIKGFVIDNSGATIGDEIDVIDFDTPAEFQNSRLKTDITGRVYCFAADANDDDIVLAYSDDNGGTWTSDAPIEVFSHASYVYNPEDIVINQLGIIFCLFHDRTNDKLYNVQRGNPEEYSATGFPVPFDSSIVSLVCGVGCQFLGGAGITGDNWQFEPEYSYAMENIISHSPQKPWRSETDNAACTIIIDTGAYVRFRATGVGLFGCNFRTLDFQMNNTDSWGSPSVGEEISFDVGTGTVDAVSGNMIQDASFLSSYVDHFFSGKGKPERYFLRMTSGTDDGETWEIKDNVSGWFVLDTTAAVNISASDTFAVFQSFFSETFTGGNYRFIRLAIAAQHTADDYYCIGVMVAGETISLTKSWRVGYGKDNIYNIDMLDTPAGSMHPVKNGDRRRKFTLNWSADSTTRLEMLGITDYIEGKNLVLIPGNSGMGDCYLVKVNGNITQKHRFHDDNFDATVPLIEVI